MVIERLTDLPCHIESSSLLQDSTTVGLTGTTGDSESADICHQSRDKIDVVHEYM